MSDGARDNSVSLLRYVSAGRTHVGHIREINEDALVCRDDIGVWAVADGMGGHDRGDFASRTVTRQLGLIALCATPKELAASVLDGLQGANSIILEASEDSETIIGTTVVALLLHGGNALAIWAGDSRLYRLRNAELEQITHDHTVVQHLVDGGSLPEGEADSHPHAHVLTQAIGISRELTVDVTEVDVQPGDRLIMLSDGVYGCVPTEILATAVAGGSPSEAADGLIAAVLAGEAPDNATAVIVDVEAQA